MKKMLFSLFLGALLMASGAALAQEQQGGAVPPDATVRGGPLAKLQARLNLSPEQREQIDNLMAAKREEWRGLAENIVEAHKKVSAETHALPFDEQKIRAAYKEVAKYEEELAVKRGQMFSEISKILNAEQQKMLDECLTERSKTNYRRQLGRYLMDSWVMQNGNGKKGK